MTNYRRHFYPGGLYFLNLAERRSSLLTEKISLLRAAFRYTRARHPHETVAIVVLPDHLHAIWRLPGGDADFSTRWRQIKSAFRGVCLQMNEYRPAACTKANAASGSGVSGSTQSAMNGILRVMSIPSISTRQSMDMCAAHAIGLIHRSVAWSGSGFIRNWGGDFAEDYCEFGEM